MRTTIPVLAALLVLLCGCVTSSNYQDPVEALRDSTIDLVGAYADATKNYYEKHGERATIEAAKNAVRNELKDPDSAQFRNVGLVNYQNGKVACGEVNAKNSYGGYVGYRRFIASNFDSMILKADGVSSSADDASNAGIYAACGGHFK